MENNMSSLAEAMILANLLGNNTFETRRQTKSASPFDDFRRYQDWQDRKQEVKEKKEKEKKDKDKKPEHKIGYLEAVFWLFFLSPIIGPLWYNLENLIIKSMH